MENLTELLKKIALMPDEKSITDFETSYNCKKMNTILSNDKIFWNDLLLHSGFINHVVKEELTELLKKIALMPDEKSITDFEEIFECRRHDQLFCPAKHKFWKDLLLNTGLLSLTTKKCKNCEHSNE